MFTLTRSRLARGAVVARSMERLGVAPTAAVRRTGGKDFVEDAMTAPHSLGMRVRVSLKVAEGGKGVCRLCDVAWLQLQRFAAAQTDRGSVGARQLDLRRVTVACSGPAVDSERYSLPVCRVELVEGETVCSSQRVFDGERIDMQELRYAVRRAQNLAVAP